MLEPLAASVFSTVLSARHLAVPSSTQSALKTMGRATTSSFPTNFFSPHPRRSAKGKERADAGVYCGLFVDGGVTSGSTSDMATTPTSGMWTIPVL